MQSCKTSWPLTAKAVSELDCCFRLGTLSPLGSGIFILPSTPRDLVLGQGMLCGMNWHPCDGLGPARQLLALACSYPISSIVAREECLSQISSPLPRPSAGWGASLSHPAPSESAPVTQPCPRLPQPPKEDTPPSARRAPHPRRGAASPALARSLPGRPRARRGALWDGTWRRRWRQRPGLRPRLPRATPEESRGPPARRQGRRPRPGSWHLCLASQAPAADSAGERGALPRGRTVADQPAG